MMMASSSSGKSSSGSSSRSSSSRGTENRGPAEGEAYGVAGLTQRLHGIKLPLSKNDLIDQFGDQEFEWTKGGERLSLRECLESAPEEIQSVTQITQAVSEFHKSGAHQGRGSKNSDE